MKRTVLDIEGVFATHESTIARPEKLFGAQYGANTTHLEAQHQESMSKTTETVPIVQNSPSGLDFSQAVAGLGIGPDQAEEMMGNQKYESQTATDNDETKAMHTLMMQLSPDDRAQLKMIQGEGEGMM